MTEQLFQFLWRHSLFHSEGLQTTRGERLLILSPGIPNQDAGPDFREGKVKIGTTTWVGSIELHLKSSDWLRHGHQHDPRYQKIILHVVLEADVDVPGNFPTLVLGAQLQQGVVARYEKLLCRPDYIPCHHLLSEVPELVWKSWLTRLLAERWEQRLEEWENLWHFARQDWRVLFYYRMAANFGFHVNRDAFLDLARSLPLTILGKHRKNLTQLEALLFGQAGLLGGSVQDDYTTTLEQEYHFLRRKYALDPLTPERWKFLRLRPANFPTIRLAQFAMLLHRSLNLFSQMMEIETAKAFAPLLRLHAGSYWDTHYRLSEPAKDQSVKHLGKDAFHNILINTVAPMQFLYARLQGKTNLQETSIKLLQSLPAEKNRIIRAWQQRGIKAADAAESQALIQLFQYYCSAKKCLQCAIGHKVLKMAAT